MCKRNHPYFDRLVTYLLAKRSPSQKYKNTGTLSVNLQEVISPALETAARLGRRTRGAGLRQLEVMGRKRFVLSTDDDNESRSRCE